MIVRELMKYRTPLECETAARYFGTLAAAHMLVIRDYGHGTHEWITPRGLDWSEEDAVMFAKLAYRGWKELQVWNHRTN
jgi:hypothetical protein